MWKKLSVSLAAAAAAACCPLSAGDSCGSANCPDGKKDASCQTMTDPCTMQGQKACCTNRKVVKITPVRKVSDQDPGFIAIMEEYSVTTEVPVQGQAQDASGSGKAEVSAK